MILMDLQGDRERREQVIVWYSFSSGKTRPGVKLRDLNALDIRRGIRLDGRFRMTQQMRWCFPDQFISDR